MPLNLSMEPSSKREDLIESSANATAIAMIDAWPNWPGQLVVLAGPVGSGKSHIANVWLNVAGGMSCQANLIGADALDIQKTIENGGNILVEDAGMDAFDETALFHLLNSVRQSGSYCMITSRSWPTQWNVELPDLLSRLKASQVVELQEPDDLLLKQVMMKLFADRQLAVDGKIIDYCVLRMERSLETAAKLVEKIDQEALSNKSSITRSTASKVLEMLGMG